MSARALLLLVVVALFCAAIGFTVLRCEGEAPALQTPEEALVGRDGAEVTLSVRDADSGLRHVRVSLLHAKGEQVLLDRAFEGGLLRGGAHPDRPETLTVPIDPEALGLAEGSAQLGIEVRDWSWRDTLSGNAARMEIPVTVDLRRPRIEVASGLTYVRRGGSGAVVYAVGEPVVRDGVQVGDAFFPGHPLPGTRDERRRFALFAIPRDAPPDVSIQVTAEDRVGNRGSAGWATRLLPQEFEDVQIRLPESFLRNKVPALAEAVGVGGEDPLASFQEINTRIRAENEARIREIVSASDAERRWQGVFEQLENSQVTSRFAEHRSYYVDGERVSEAIHYGFDLATTARSPVTAANAGKVIFADELGIYGNTVVIDHGVGLSSLYAHLSSFDVEVGDVVEKGQRVGLSGETGLAGGDHLHFAMLVGETYVDPVEWWDPKWVREHVEEELGSPEP